LTSKERSITRGGGGLPHGGVPSPGRAQYPIGGGDVTIDGTNRTERNGGADGGEGGAWELGEKMSLRHLGGLAEACLLLNRGNSL